MKKLILRTMMIAALSTAAVFAQGGIGRMHDSDATADPAERIARRVEFLKALLTLTDAQATQATTIFTNAEAAATTPRASLETARASLKDSIKSNSTANIDSLSTQIGTLTSQLTAIQSKAEAAFYALLTADQKTRYDAVGGGRGPGGGGRN